MSYHKVDENIWTSKQFRSLGDYGRLLAMYLHTCSHRNTEGLFRLPLILAAYELGWESGRAGHAFDEIEDAGLALRDTEEDLVWLTTALATDPPRGPKQIAGAIKQLKAVPESPLRACYLAQARILCPELADAIDADLDWQEPPETEGSDTPPEGYRNPIGEVPDTPSIPHSHSPPLTHTPPTPPTVTQDRARANPGGGGKSSTTATSDHATSHTRPGTAMATATRLLALAGVDDGKPPDGPELSNLARAIDRGWTDAQLDELAAYVLANATTSRRGLLRKRLGDYAGQDPPARPIHPDDRRPTVPEFEPDSDEMDTDAAGPGLDAARAVLAEKVAVD